MHGRGGIGGAVVEVVELLDVVVDDGVVVVVVVVDEDDVVVVEDVVVEDVVVLDEEDVVDDVLVTGTHEIPTGPFSPQTKLPPTFSATFLRGLT
jgi:hypothetical protein